MKKLNSKNKNAKIFALAFAAFLANAGGLLFADANVNNENSSPIAGINKGDFDILKSQSSAQSFEKAVLVYEKFGYVAPLVELAKTDAKAKEKLGEIMKFLSQSDGLNKYGFLKLAEIYYMQGDFENFAKYASADRVLSAQRLISPYGSVLDYPASIEIESYNISAAQGRIMQNLISRDKIDDAVRIFRTLSNLSECNDWYLYTASLKIYSKTSDIALKKEILNILENRKFNTGDYDKNISIYVLTDGDPNFKEYFEKAQAGIANIPKEKLWRKFLDIYRYGNIEDDDKRIFYLEKLFESGAEMSSDEKSSLANYYLSGGKSFYYNSDNDFNAEILKANPKLNQILKLLAESYSLEDYNSNAALLMNIYKALGDIDSAKFWANKILESSKLHSSWKLKNEIIRSITKDDYSVFSKEDIEEIISTFSDSEKGEFYSRIANSFLDRWNGTPKNIKKGKEYLKKALAYGAKYLSYNVIYYFDEDEVKEIMKNKEDNIEFLLEYAKNLTSKGKWDEAFKYYQKAYDKGSAVASVGLFICYDSGKGTKKNTEKANELLSKIVLEVRNEYDTPFPYGRLNSILSYIDFDNSRIREKVLTALLKNPNVSASARVDLLMIYDSTAYADENRSEKIKNLLKNISYSDSNDTVLALKNFYIKDGEFQDLKKAFQLSERLLNIPHYSTDDDCTYIWMLAFGIGVEKDEKKAFESIKKVNKFSNYDRGYALYAYFYENGIGVEKDLEKAKEYRSKIKDFNFAFSCFRATYAPPKAPDYLYYLAKYLEEGKYYYTTFVDIYKNGSRGVPRSIEKALTEAEKLSKDDYEMLFKIAKIYKETGPSYNPQKYFEYLNKYADKFAEMEEKKPAALLMEFGYAYMNGRGTPKDEKKAFECFSEAMTRPFTYNSALDSYEAVAYCYENGLGVEKNLKKAEELRAEIKKIALETRPSWIWNVMKVYDPGSANLCSDINRYIEWLKFYANARPTARNVSELFLIYTRKPQVRDWKKALEYLNLYEKYWAQTNWINYRIGYFNLFGIEMPKNEKKGLEYLKRSAEADYPYAMEKLSYIYEKGIGVEKNVEESSKWLEKFKDLSAPPFIEIASRYVRGSDFTEDKERAKFILKLGADMGNDDCIYYLQNFDVFVESRMAASSAEYWDAKRKK